MEMRKIMMDAAADSGATEVFDSTEVTKLMSEVVTYKDNIKKLIDALTDELSEKITNEGTSQAYGGDISAFWSKWNGFTETFENDFCAMITKKDQEVADAAAAEVSYQATVDATLNSSSSTTSTYGG